MCLEGMKKFGGRFEGWVCVSPVDWELEATGGTRRAVSGSVAPPSVSQAPSSALPTLFRAAATSEAPRGQTPSTTLAVSKTKVAAPSQGLGMASSNADAEGSEEDEDSGDSTTMRGRARTGTGWGWLHHATPRMEMGTRVRTGQQGDGEEEEEEDRHSHLPPSTTIVYHCIYFLISNKIYLIMLITRKTKSNKYKN